MANLNLILNQPQVATGLQTWAFTIPTTGPYSILVSSTFPGADAVNAAATQTAGAGNNTQVQQPFGAGSGMGLGAAPGGGGEGFVSGDGGTGSGGVGQGFGTGNNYQQPPADGSNAVYQSPTTSGLQILVKQNNVTGFTFSNPGLIQSAAQFKYQFLATAADAILVVASSSVSTDKQLSGVTTIVSIQAGF